MSDTAARPSCVSVDLIAAVAETARDALIISNARDEVIWCNDAVRKLTGFKLEDFHGKLPSELVWGPDSGRDKLRDIVRAIRRRKALLTEVMLYGSDGEPIWTEMGLHHARDEASGEWYYFSSFRDIRERKAREAETERQARVLNEMSQMANIGAWTLDLDSGALFWSEQTFRIHDLPVAEQAPDLKTAKGFYTSSVHERLASEVDRICKTGGVYDMTVPLTTAKGREIWVRTLGYSQEDDSGQVPTIQGVIHDVTEQKRREDQLKEAERRARRADDAKSRFLANMSHELRTPMNGVIGMIEALLIDGRAPEAIREDLSIARNSARSMLQIMNDILDLSRLETGMMQINAEPFSLADLKRSMDDLFRSEARKKRLGYECTLHPDLPDWVEGDSLRLRQVLTNLVGNALKFTEQGGVLLRIRPAETTGLIRFEVLDTGPGIPEAERARIFERFTQLDDSSSRRHQGAGLGLAITRDLVDLMGGEMGVISSGRGSRFSFELPLPQAQAMADTPTSLDRAADPSGLRVLLAEDNPANRRVVALMLEAAGCDVFEAENGQEALAALSATPVDALLMDINMPVLNGEEALKRLRARVDDSASTPVIALTANAMAGDRERYLMMGFDGYVAKPISPRALLSEIASVTEAARARLLDGAPVRAAS